MVDGGCGQGSLKRACFKLLGHTPSTSGKEKKYAHQKSSRFMIDQGSSGKGGID